MIVFEEFASQIPIEEMLNLLDIYPLMLPARYSDKVACYTKVYITSNLPLGRQYQAVQQYHPETWKAFLRRIRTFTAQLPWLVCSIDGQVAGYGYASPHRTRAAYQWSVETSIYVAPEFPRRGVARALYSALFELLRMQGYYNIYVGITSPNERSMKFHKSMGFIISGAYQESMYKFGQWRDVLWMGKSLRPHEGEPQPAVPFPEIQDSPLVDRVLRQAEQRIHL